MNLLTRFRGAEFNNTEKAHQKGDSCGFGGLLLFVA